MGKIITFSKYLIDFIKHGEFLFIFTSIKYIILKKTSCKTRLYKSSLGLFISRKRTIDFMFLNYAYEWNVKKIMLNRYKDYNVFIDIGANVGTYSFLLAQKKIKCFAFEPVRKTFKALTMNIMLNDLENEITAFNFGLGSVNSNADFIYVPDNTGASHRAEIGENDHDHVNVEIRTLDSIYNNLRLNSDDKILMKIDVEGMEFNVIEGSIKFLRTYPNIFIVMESIHSDEEKLKSLLKSIANFEFYKVDRFNMAAKKLSILN